VGNPHKSRQAFCAPGEEGRGLSEPASHAQILLARKRTSEELWTRSDTRRRDGCFRAAGFRYNAPQDGVPLKSGAGFASSAFLDQPVKIIGAVTSKSIGVKMEPS
jgi:hypothetical protein